MTFPENLQVGDHVLRYLSSARIPMVLPVTAIDDQLIHCLDWTFDRATGAEIDEDLGWGNNLTGSWLERKLTPEEVEQVKARGQEAVKELFG